MITSLDSLYVGAQQTRTLAVAAAHDAPVLLAVEAARKAGLAKAVLVGDEAQLSQLAEQYAIPLSEYTVMHEMDAAEACRTAVRLVREGKADVLMKGLVDTSVILKAVLDKENGLRDAAVLSHVAVFDVPNFDRLLYVTDAAMNIAPDAEAKKHIIGNAVKVAHALGNPEPVVAALCAVEKVNPKMPATLDAQILAQADIPGCRVIGPLALDNAISAEAAHHKGITDPDAGHADILLVPYIEAGNILYKALTYLAGARNAGIIVGAKAPIVLTSRADSDEAKFLSIALALYVAANAPKETLE